MLLIIANAQTKNIKMIILTRETDVLLRELKTIRSFRPLGPLGPLLGNNYQPNLNVK